MIGVAASAPAKGLNTRAALSSSDRVRLASRRRRVSAHGPACSLCMPILALSPNPTCNVPYKMPTSRGVRSNTGRLVPFTIGRSQTKLGALGNWAEGMRVRGGPEREIGRGWNGRFQLSNEWECLRWTGPRHGAYHLGAMRQMVLIHRG